MYEIIKKNLDTKKVIVSFGAVIALLILIIISYQSDNKETRKTRGF